MRYSFTGELGSGADPDPDRSAGRGETTAALALADRAPHSVHLESDSFFRSVRSGFIAPWKPESHPQNLIVMRAVASAAREYAAGGYFTILEGIVLPQWFLDPLRAAFDQAGERSAEEVAELIERRVGDGSLAL